MTSWFLRPLAEADVEAIIDYTATSWGQTQALKYLGELQAAFDRLCIDRWRGTPLTGRHGTMLRYRIGSHIVIFQRNGKTTDVVRILHERMDIEAQLDS